MEDLPKDPKIAGLLLTDFGQYRGLAMSLKQPLGTSNEKIIHNHNIVYRGSISDGTLRAREKNTRRTNTRRRNGV